MSTVNPIFQGVLPNACTNAIAEYVRKHQSNWDIYSVPFVGRFTVCEAIARVTGKPEQIYCSDISLFSDMMGAYFNDELLDPLGLDIHTAELKHLREYMNNEAEHVALSLFLIKYAQLTARPQYYYQAFLKEMQRTPDKYIKHLSASIKAMKENLRGIRYRHLDYREELKLNMDNERAFIICDPPTIKGGYKKMFDPKNIYSWYEPPVSWFNPEELDSLLDKLKSVKASTMLMKYHELNAHPGWRVVAQGSARTGYITAKSTWQMLSNEGFDPTLAARFHKEVEGRFQVFNNDVVTRGTKVAVLKVKAEEAQYYRSLLVHKLGQSGGESHFLVLLGNKVACVIGLMLTPYRKGGLDCLYLNYNIMASNIREPKLHRLIFGILYSTAFKRELISQSPSLWNTLQFRDFSKFRSTTIHAFPDIRNEYKGTRMVSSDKVKAGRTTDTKMGVGMWKVVYEHDIERKTYKQLIAEFVQYKEKQARVL